MSQICQKCNKTVKAVRIDLDLPHDERKWICDKCFWSKDDKDRIITPCKQNLKIREKSGMKMEHL